MWAPADLFTPVVNAAALALKRTVSLAWDNLLYLFIALGVLIALWVALAQIRSRRRR